MTETLSLKIGLGENGIEASGDPDAVMKALDKFLVAMQGRAVGATGGEEPQSDGERQFLGLLDAENKRT